jgi:hypothetical protein
VRVLPGYTKINFPVKTFRGGKPECADNAFYLNGLWAPDSGIACKVCKFGFKDPMNPASGCFEARNCTAEGKLPAVDPSSCRVDYSTNPPSYYCTKCMSDALDPTTPLIPIEKPNSTTQPLLPILPGLNPILPVVVNKDGVDYVPINGEWVPESSLPDNTSNGPETTSGDFIDANTGVNLYENWNLTKGYLEALAVGGIPVGYVAWSNGYPSMIVLYGFIGFVGPRFVKEVMKLLGWYLWKGEFQGRILELRILEWLKSGKGIVLTTAVGGTSALLSGIAAVYYYKLLPDSVLGYVFLAGAGAIALALIVEYFLYFFSWKSVLKGIENFVRAIAKAIWSVIGL